LKKLAHFDRFGEMHIESCLQRFVSEGITRTSAESDGGNGEAGVSNLLNEGISVTVGHSDIADD
jgi:hypothetical protein